MRGKKKALNICMVIIGTFLLAAAVEFFILPYNILSGGVAGIAVAVEPFLHIDETLFANVLVLILLMIGWAVLGREFLVNTCLSSVCYPLFTWLCSLIAQPIDIEPFLASFYGGLLGGIGIGMVMRTGASTGGMDVPPLIIHKLFGTKISTLVMIIDGLTVLLGLAAYDISAVLIGMISVFSSSFAINWVLSAEGSVSKSVQIISDQWMEIKKEIDSRLSRGTTILDATGGFTDQPRKIILCVVSQNEYHELIDLINEIDDKAFIITTDATDMHGEGFSFKYRI